MYNENTVKTNEDLRIGFILGDFDEDLWKMKLVNREKKRMKKRAIHTLMMTTVVVLKDFVRKVCADRTMANTVVQEFINLNEYYLDSMDKICNVHGGSGCSMLMCLNMV
jgi:hypothetical protein